MKQITINANDTPPVYQSTNIDRNEDGTYKITHKFVNKNNKEIKFEYPRVRLELDNGIGLSFYPSNGKYDLINPMLVFSEVMVLQGDRQDAKNELFRIIMENE